MMHVFKAGKLLHECDICHIVEQEHHCAVCDCTLVEKLYGNMLFCAAHKEAELAAQKESEAMAEQRVKDLETNRPPVILPQPDSTIQITSDIFNAKIAAINDWKKEIESDESIPPDKKHFALANKMQERYMHLKQVIMDAQLALKDSQNEQRAIQTYYNDLAKKLREEEREKIKIQDVQYRPPEKPVKKISAPKVKVYDKASIKTAAQESGLPEMLITLTCTARNVSAVEAVRIIQSVKKS